MLITNSYAAGPPGQTLAAVTDAAASAVALDKIEQLLAAHKLQQKTTASSITQLRADLNGLNSSGNQFENWLLGGTGVALLAALGLLAYTHWMGRNRGAVKPTTSGSFKASDFAPAGTISDALRDSVRTPHMANAPPDVDISFDLDSAQYSQPLSHGVTTYQDEGSTIDFELPEIDDEGIAAIRNDDTMNYPAFSSKPAQR